MWRGGGEEAADENLSSLPAPSKLNAVLNEGRAGVVAKPPC